MDPNPFLGVVFHWLGGLAAGSFYVPFMFVKKWSWEVYWLLGGFFSWIVVPWVVAFVMIPHIGLILQQQPFSVIAWTFFWGAMWGFGGLTYGLTMRYLGLSLGTAIVLGLTAVFGTYMPPIFNGTIASKLFSIPGGVIFIGMVTTLIGIMISASAGLSKEREMNEAQKHKAVKEFNLRKGILVALFSGVMSACFAYGLASGEPIATTALHYGIAPIWSGLPKLIVVMAGGFLTNFVWCSFLLFKHRSLRQYASRVEPVVEEEPLLEVSNSANADASDSPIEENNVKGEISLANAKVPLVWNYFFSALAGTVWYFQFFFYTMGESQMGSYKFSSWTIHMASIIIFGSLWGIFLKEWKDTGGLSKFLLALSLFTLVGSTLIVGYGNFLALRLGAR